MSNLLNQLVRLAHSKPELRDYLLPIIEKEAAGHASTLRALKVGDTVLVHSTELRKARKVKITKIEEKTVGKSKWYRAYTSGGKTRSGPSGGELLDKGDGKVTFQASMRQQTGYVKKLEKV